MKVLNYKGKRVLSVFIVVFMVLTLMPSLSNTALAADVAVPITNSMTAASIESAIQDEINNASPGDTVTVTGSKTNEDGMIILTIPAGITVAWRATSVGLSLFVSGGIFEVATGGRITVDGKNAIEVDTGNVIVSGGEVSVLRTAARDFNKRIAINVTNGNVTVSGGKVAVSSTMYGSATAISVDNGGVVVSGGEVSVTRSSDSDTNYCNTIFVNEGKVTVSGGKVLATDNSSTIRLFTGNVVVSGGEVSSTGTASRAYNCNGIWIDEFGTVAVTGGKVSASGSSNTNNAIYLGYGLAAYLEGTCYGSFDFYYHQVYSMVVEVGQSVTPVNGDNNGLTRVAGGAISDVRWDTDGNNCYITYYYDDDHYDDYGGYYYWIPWVTAPTSEEGHVILHETRDGVLDGTRYFALNDAIDAAKKGGYDTISLEVDGDLYEENLVLITSDIDITLYGSNGEHTISHCSIEVRGGGKLTLGTGNNNNVLTLLGTVSVFNGNVDAKDGISIQGGTFALSLFGQNATGSISGGRFEGSVSSFPYAYTAALRLGEGAIITEISGGKFYGRNDAVHVTDAGTEIVLISGGEFYQTNNLVTLHGHAVFVQNDAKIGKISGGLFAAKLNCAMVVIRGAWVGEISGGDFIVNRIGTTANNDRNAAVWIESEGVKTGIGKISGGYFGTSQYPVPGYGGGFFGMLVINEDDYESIEEKAQIGEITGGTFLGYVGLQNDRYASIGTISGGDFTGTVSFSTYGYGIFNVGTINLITGDALIAGEGDGIWNYRGGLIKEISGGVIMSTGESYFGGGIYNEGTIELISGGMIIGDYNAISCAGLNYGRLNTISGGVFWGKHSRAITLGYELQLEPGLTDEAFGFGRFLSGDDGAGAIFNNEELVKYPFNEDAERYYYMSFPDDTKEVTVDGGKVNFRYLRLPEAINQEYVVTVHGSYADPNGEGRYTEGDKVTLDAGARPGYTFAGWTTEDEDVIAGFIQLDSVYEFDMPAHHVTVWATWTNLPTFPTKYKVTVINSYANGNEGALYEDYYFEEETVNIDAGSRPGYTFVGWEMEGEDRLFAFFSPTASFVMPAKDVVLTAIWAHSPGFWFVEVVDSKAPVAQNGHGGYREGVTVYIDAGVHPDPDYIFTGWVTDDDVALNEPYSQTTRFIMPAENITVTATWEEIHSYTVTVNGSYADNTGAGVYPEGSIVTINAGSRYRHSFTGWTTSDGVSFNNANDPTTTFTMPAHDVTVTANWKYIGGGGNPNPPPEPPVVTPPGTSPPSPQTGDGGVPPHLFLMAILSLVGIGLSLWIGKRKQKTYNGGKG